MKTLFDWEPNELATELQLRCEVLGKVIDAVGPLELKPKSDHFRSLTEAILSQQLSTKAAATITRRFYELLGGSPHPERILAINPSKMRAVGVSGQKASYLLDLSRHFTEEANDYEGLELLEDREIIERLVRIKGIGVWSAQMFLIFSLGRPEVFPVDDLGIRNAVTALYPKEAPTSKREWLAFGDRYEPLQSAASLYLWRSLNL